MKGLLLFVVFAIPGIAPAAEKNLWDELLDVTVARIQRDGPDQDAAQFISMAQSHAWARKEELAKLLAPFLADKQAERVAAALAIFYRLRGYRPSGPPAMDFETRHAPFFADLDKAVNEQHEHFRELKSDSVFRPLALYLSHARTEALRSWLWEIARSPSVGKAKDQVLICLTWQRNPADMDALLPFMLENSSEAFSLPYHFRTSYGSAAVPYLRKAVADAESKNVRQEAQKQLALLEQEPAATSTQK